MDEDITFNGYPVTLEYRDGEVYINCKGVTGTLSDMHKYYKDKSKLTKRFGQSKIRCWHKGLVKIDCLEDTDEQGTKIYELAKKLKDGKTSN